MEEGVKLLPSAPQGDFLPKEEQPPRSKPIELPTTTLTLHSDRINHVHNSQCQRSKKKSSNFFDKIDPEIHSDFLKTFLGLVHVSALSLPGSLFFKWSRGR